MWQEMTEQNRFFAPLKMTREWSEWHKGVVESGQDQKCGKWSWPNAGDACVYNKSSREKYPAALFVFRSGSLGKFSMCLSFSAKINRLFWFCTFFDVTIWFGEPNTNIGALWSRFWTLHRKWNTDQNLLCWICPAACTVVDSLLELPRKVKQFYL